MPTPMSGMRYDRLCTEQRDEFLSLMEVAFDERQLFEQMEQAVHPYLEKYTHPDGRLVYEPGLRGELACSLTPQRR